MGRPFSPAFLALTVERVSAEIHAFNGNVAAVCKTLNITRRQLMTFFDMHPELAEELQVAREEMLDMAESSLYRRVLAGDAWAVCFFLKTQGRKRGYIERGETFNLNVNLDNLSIEQLERLAAGEHPSLVLNNAPANSEGPGTGTATTDLDSIEGTSSLSPEEEAVS
jgi:hypothetical protein